MLHVLRHDMKEPEVLKDHTKATAMRFYRSRLHRTRKSKKQV
jgi:hypothetical protein